ncbi:MAG: primosomal protein N' (replication factor Y) - superfamily II helicase, partial [Sulfitobacter sp.]
MRTQEPATPLAEHHFPCDACGSDLRFEPASQDLLCDHCGNAEPLGQGQGRAKSIKEQDYRSAVSGVLAQAEVVETRISKCPNCAAEVEFDPSVHAAECPFCATPVVVDTGVQRRIKPHGVLPFALTQE